jgi:hypothetical protein
MAPQALGAGKPKKPPEMGLEVTVAPDPATVGEKTKVSVVVVPPEGISLNRYPGITLTVLGAKGLALEADQVFVGTKEPPEDLSKNAFDEVDPLVLTLTPERRGGRSRSIDGKLKFFYCVKKSGYCAPAEQEVRIKVPVGS